MNNYLILSGVINSEISLSIFQESLTGWRDLVEDIERNKHETVI